MKMNEMCVFSAPEAELPFVFTLHYTSSPRKMYSVRSFPSSRMNSIFISGQAFLTLQMLTFLLLLHVCVLWRKTMRMSVQTQPASIERLPFGSLCLVCPSQEVVSRVVLHPLSLQLFLFHPSVLEPDFHLSSIATKRGNVEKWSNSQMWYFSFSFFTLKKMFM